MRFTRACALIWLALLCTLASAQPITITDAMGRSVTLKAPAKRIILTQARHMPVLALLHPDPVSLLAGWSDEFRTSFSNEYQTYLERFPNIARIPIVGRHTADSFSVEQALSLQPDLIVLTASFAGVGKGQNPEDSLMMKQFAAAGIPVIIIDFFVQPLQNTVPSLRALGQAIDQEARTEAFIKLYESHMAAVAQRLTDVPADDRPPVFIHAHAGSTDCCNSPGTGTFNNMVEYAGGHNIGSDVLKTVTGRLNFEYINARNPVVYVATGTGSGKRASSGLDIGTGATEKQARASLQRIIESNRLGALPAIRNGNAHGIWHAFNDSPLHVIFIEALAGWLHPDRFTDISAQDTLAEINKHFLTVPLQGTYMVNLNK
ncbi:ABC transporter substrate-binding protein [Pusillimonas sp. ANT_WB101]|uniref:ABC transporter substrate-binding protein n=1 Tax=Pusillimonas sp. ANT_WB101 TaxID=2597356 RepID=UPI002104EB9A|nr:ABC transporter substrate-binding protein [Pusillimonas sp. ANT_WB101]